MLPTFLLPESIIREGGKSPEIPLSSPVETLLVTLGITQVIEQESLDVFIYGSADGTTWDPKPLLRFPQKFYCGVYSMLLDLTRHPTVKFIRAEYKVNRWGRGEPKPLFGVWLFAADSTGKNTATRAVA